jgi:hypothetical protein
MQLTARAVPPDPYHRRVDPEAPTLVWQTYTTDSAFPRRLVHAQFRLPQTQRAVFVAGALLAVVLLLLLDGSASEALMLVVVLVAVSGVVYVLSLAQARKQLPVGSVCRAALGPDALLTETPMGSAVMPYGVFARIRTTEHVVMLQNARGKGWVAMPRAVFSGAVLDELRERVRQAEPPAGPGAQPPDGPRSTWTVDAGYAKRVTGALLAHSVLSPARAGVLSLTIVGAVVVMKLATGADAVPGAVLVAIPVIVVVVVFVFMGLSVRRQVSKQIPAGSTYGLVIGSEGLWIDGASGSGLLPYATLRAPRLRGDIVLLRTKPSGPLLALPAQLFPAGALVDVQRRIAVANPRPAPGA